MTTTSKTLPARVTWWQMFQIVHSENSALGPYLKLWTGPNPFRSLNLVRISVVAIASGFVMALNGDKVDMRFVCVLLGAATLMVGLIVGLPNAMCLIKTVIAFKYIWNSDKLEMLTGRWVDDVAIKSVLAPATVWASEIMELESHGFDHLPKGRRKKKVLKNKIDTYVSACLGMGLGREVMTHKELVEKAFQFAQRN